MGLHSSGAYPSPFSSVYSASTTSPSSPAAADEGDVVDAEYTEEKRDG